MNSGNKLGIPVIFNNFTCSWQDTIVKTKKEILFYYRISKNYQINGIKIKIDARNNKSIHKQFILYKNI